MCQGEKFTVDMLKRKARPLNVNFTPEEHKLLEDLAARDKREKATEVRWLVECYAKGELLTKSQVLEWLHQVEKSIPPLKGTSLQGLIPVTDSVETEPERKPDRQPSQEPKQFQKPPKHH